MSAKKRITKAESNIKIQARALIKQLGLDLTVCDAVQIIKTKREKALEIKKAAIIASDNGISYSAFHKRVSRGWDLHTASTKLMGNSI